MGKLDGKVCILTGAASGLGRPEALLLAEEGARGIAICDIPEEKLMETKRLCEEAGAEVIAIPMDVRDVNKLQELVDATVEKWGTVDILVNNVHCTTLLPFVDQKAETMQREFEISYFSTWHLMQMCYPYLKDKPGAGASIINFGSRWGQESPCLSSTYSPVKEAIRALSRTVAREWGINNIRVNCICPGGFTDNAQNDMHLQLPEMQEYAMNAFKDNCFHRVGEPHDDVAPIVVFLASDESHWITGQTINADGGGWICA